MKKLFLLAAIVLTTQLSFSTNTPSVNLLATQSFNRDFYKATHVQWQHFETYDQASFLLDNRLMSAYYTPEGDLIAVTRNIVADQLPLRLLLELKKNYAAHWISELFEVVNGGGDYYYVTLENADEKLILKAKANRSWKLYKRIVKI